MIRTTSAQLVEIQEAIHKPNAYRNEKIWTFLVACLFDRAPEQSKMVERLCGEPLKLDRRLDISHRRNVSGPFGRSNDPPHNTGPARRDVQGATKSNAP